MIPGIGKFEPGSINSGGFEIVIGIGTYAERRDEMLKMYRENNIAPRGMHVTNRVQDPGAAELPEGVVMTPEIRAEIAKRRAEAGYTCMPVGAKVEEVGPDLREDEAYLDGVVSAPNWAAIGAKIDERLTPMTIVMPRELPCPDDETRARVNHEFWALLRNDVDEAEETCRGFAAAWIPMASKALMVWPPEEQESFSTSVPYTHRGARYEASLEHYVVEETITLEALAERKSTFRNWFADVVCATIATRLDHDFVVRLRDKTPIQILSATNAHCMDDALKNATASLYGSTPEAWLFTPEVQDRLDMVPGQVVENIPGTQLICSEAYPLEPGMALARGPFPGLHIELPDAFEVELELCPRGETLTVRLSYWNALDIPDGQGFALIRVEDSHAL